MVDASLVSTCSALFSDKAYAASKLKALLLEADCSKGADQGNDIADLRGAIDMLHACMISATGAGNRRRLEQAEDLCVILNQRPSNTPFTAGIHARARFALALVNLERGEVEVCALNIAHGFAKDPRWSRVMFPEIFDAVFRPLCAPIYHQLERDEARAREKTYYAPIIAKRAGAVAVGAGVLAGAIAAACGVMAATGMKQNPIGGAGRTLGKLLSETAAPIWRSANDGKARAAELVRIRKRHEGQIDQQCRSLALEFL